MSNSSINIQGAEFTGNNLGTGTTIYDSVNPFNTLNFKSLVGAGSISVVSGTSEVTISASTGSGQANTASNVGTGQGLYSTKVADDLRFKTLIGTGNITLTDSGSEIIISGTSAASSAAGLNTEIQFNNGGTSLGASSGFTFINTTESLSVGVRSGGVEGDKSFAQGLYNTASGDYSHAEGFSNTASGNFSHAEGKNTIASGAGSHAEGLCTCANNSYSHTEGRCSRAYGAGSHAEGDYTRACGNYSHTEGRLAYACGAGSHAGGVSTRAYGNFSHASGQGNFSSTQLFACGCVSFNHSKNCNTQTAGHGAMADFSAILGGIDHNIEVGNTNAAIIGGNAIKLTGTSYIDTTAVDNLAIITIPTSGNSTQILARNITTGVIEYTTVSGGGTGGTTNPAGADTQIQFNNSGSFGANSKFIFDNVKCGLTVGTRFAGTVGNCSVTNGNTNLASGTGSFAQGGLNCAVGSYSSAIGLCTKALDQNSHSEGLRTFAYGQRSHVEGSGSKSCGLASHAEGSYTIALGDNSHSEGNGTQANGTNSHASGQATRAIGTNSFSQGLSNTSCAPQSATLGGLSNTIEVGNTNATIIGGNAIVLTGTDFIDTTAVSKFAIMNIPTSSAGLPSGMIWSNGGVLTIIP